MKKLIVVICIALLAAQGRVFADAAPPGLGIAQQLGVLPTIMIGITLSASFVLGGIMAARSGQRAVGCALFAAVGVILLITLLSVSLALSRHRRDGPRQPSPLTPDEVGLAVSLFAATPDAGFPPCLPWPAIAVNRHRFEHWDEREHLFVIELPPPPADKSDGRQ